MRNKILIITILLVVFVGVKLNVFAATYQECNSDSSSCTFKAEYEKAFSKEVTSSDTVTVYARSVCSSGSCTYRYQGQYSDVGDVLKKGIKCTNGESYINYKLSSSGGASFKGTSTYEGTVYWNEDYVVTCTTNSTSTSDSKNVALKESSSSGNTSGNTSSDSSSGTSDTSTGTSTGTSTSGDSYQSSDTVDNEETGVNTYFIVLGIVAIISYGFMLVVKKYNLFKKI